MGCLAGLPVGVVSIPDVLANQRPWWIASGDARTVLRTLPDACISCVVTSPPYYQLRRYLPNGHPDQPLELGLEPTLDVYVAALVAVFAEVKRVLHPTGTLWLVLGDSYATNPGNGRGGEGVRRGSPLLSGVPHRSGRDRSRDAKPKDLLLVPTTVALALRADGWYLRSAITWVKTAPMPESVTDRPTSATEQIYLLSKRASYHYDAAAVAQMAADSSAARAYLGQRPISDRQQAMQDAGMHGASDSLRVYDRASRNLRNAWILGPEPLDAQHYAAFPTEIPRRAILAGSSEHGVCRACSSPWRRLTERTPMLVREGPSRAGLKLAANGASSSRTAVTGTMLAPPSSTTTGWAPTCRCDADVVPALILDTFAGAGTTGLVATRLGRRFLGVDLNPDYVELSRSRILAEQGALPEHAAEVAQPVQLRLAEAAG